MLEKDRRDWQERLSKMEQDIQRNYQNAQKRSDKLVIWLAAAAIFVGLAQVLTMTEDSFLWSKGADLFTWLSSPWM